MMSKRTSEGNLNRIVLEHEKTSEFWWQMNRNFFLFGNCGTRNCTFSVVCTFQVSVNTLLSHEPTLLNVYCGYIYRTNVFMVHIISCILLTIYPTSLMLTDARKFLCGININLSYLFVDFYDSPFSFLTFKKNVNESISYFINKEKFVDMW